MEEIFQMYGVGMELQLHGVGIAASVLIILVLYAILDYSGLFYSIEVQAVKNPVGRLRVAYLYGTGPYKNCGELFGRVAKIAPHQRCMGIYYDDPKQTPASQLRYMVGSILSEHDDPVDERTRVKFQEDGFCFAELPRVESALATNFPFPWMMSLFIAIWRVYPKLGKACTEHGGKVGPSMEIYDGARINFYMPTSNIDAYYVPEAGNAPGKLKSS